jgi:hypothetical protein
VASPDVIEKVDLVAYPPRAEVQTDQDTDAPQRVQPGGGNTPGTGSQLNTGARSFQMLRSASGLEYFVDLPAEEMRAGILRYHIVVKSADGHKTFPSMIDALPTDWHFYGEGWSVRVVPADAPILLFDAATDAHRITADYRDVNYDIVRSDRPGTSAMSVLASKLAEGEHDHSFRFFFVDKIRGRAADLSTAERIVVYGRSATDQACDVQVALVTADGIAYGAMLTLRLTRSENGSVPEVSPQNPRIATENTKSTERSTKHMESCRNRIAVLTFCLFYVLCVLCVLCGSLTSIFLDRRSATH